MTRPRAKVYRLRGEMHSIMQEHYLMTSFSMQFTGLQTKQHTSMNTRLPQYCTSDMDIIIMMKKKNGRGVGSHVAVKNGETKLSALRTRTDLFR